MSDRWQILEDKEFWLALEFQISGWFRECGNPSLGGLWCDGFAPTSANDTKHGVEIYGTAWIAEGSREQRKFSFTVSVPQRILHKRQSRVDLVGVTIDMEHEQLCFTVEPVPTASPATSRETNA